ncbi:MAG: CocE/NonD family hydrolase [Novosphingobium sp.]
MKSNQDVLTGIFSGPIAGLKYQTPTCSGMTSEFGEFSYREGERVAFLVGDLVLGAVFGKARVNLADLVSRVDGEMHRLQDPILTNVARLVQTLDVEGDMSTGITILPVVHEIVGSRPIKFSPDMGPVIVHMDDPVSGFGEDPVIKKLLEDLNSGGAFTGNVPRRLRSPAAARNEVRRNMLGILRFRDVKIDLRSGSFVYADVFRPDRPGKFPVIMNFGVYGRAFVHHSIGNETEEEMHEQMEDRYFFGNSDGFMYENHESVNTVVWVPNDYAVVRVDGPGTGINPGTIGVWGIEEAEAYYDAIEWAGVQPWCNGRVGLFGMSYYAINQHAVASLQPPHLKAMVAIGTDINMYEEMFYHGGLANIDFFKTWFNNQVVPAVCGKVRAEDFTAIVKAHPFNEPDSTEVYGPRAKLFMSPDMSKTDVPQWIVAATTHGGDIHQIGSSEAYLEAPTPHKKLDFIEDWFLRSYASDSVADHMAFFDYWLKDIDNGIMDKPRIRLDIRTGNGSLYVQEENEWPIARTQYVKWYLDPAQTDAKVEGGRAECFSLASAPPAAEGKVAYSAQVGFASLFPRDLAATGVSFVSPAAESDMVLAGYMKAVLWVSADSHEMDIYVSVRVLDEDGKEVDFVGPMFIAKATNGVSPIGKGWLKVSHRKLDEKRSTHFRPKHTHLEADHAPLIRDEIVPVEIEITPNTALVRKGQRIKVDIQPYQGPGHGISHAYDAAYHDGVTNRIHTGPDMPSYIQLPLVPPA